MDKEKALKTIDKSIEKWGVEVVNAFKDLYHFANNNGLYPRVLELIDLYFPLEPIVMSNAEILQRIEDMKTMLSEEINKKCVQCGRPVVNRTMCNSCKMDKPINDLFNSDEEII